MGHRILHRRPAVRIRRGTLVAGALVTVAVTLAACGSPSGTGVASLKNTTTTTTATPSTNSAAGAGGGGSQPISAGGSSSPQAHTSLGMAGVTVQLSQCMRAHGLPNFPDPNSEGQVTLNGVDPQSASFEAAQRACAKYEPNGGKPPTAAQQQAMVAQALKFSECMRSHGVAGFPDPKISDNGGRVSISIRIQAGSGGSSLDPSSPTFQKAQKACQLLAPGRIPAGAVGGKTAR